jgi:tight adherence protein C
MVLTLLIGLGLVGAALTLVARAAVLPRLRTDENVGRIAAYGYAPGTHEPPPKREAVFPKLAAGLGAFLFRGAAAKRQEDLRKTLLAAGAWHTSAAMVLGYRAVAAVVLGGMALWTATSAGWSPVIVAIATGYAFGTGWFGPLLLIRGRARRRTERIELQLPELIDLLVVTLEAGVGFNAALQRSSERMSGELGDEIRLTLHEHQLGLAMDGALANLLTRCDGISIGQVMRDLAHDMRKRRRQIIEEKAQKAPIKLLFPLAFLILPALLLIVLYPGLYSIIQTLSGG